MLPAEPRSKALSSREIVLKYEDALRTVDLLLETRSAVWGWGWRAKCSDDGVEHHEHYQGVVVRERWEGESWEASVEDVASLYHRILERGYRERKRDPAPVNVALFFCITAAGF